jgi:hypothetical protein
MSNFNTTYPHFSAGPVLVSWETMALGYSMNGIDIQEQPVFQDLKNDAYGGQAGMPSDVQWLGAVAMITCNLNRFTPGNLENIAQFDANMQASLGSYRRVGQFVKQDGMHGQLILSSAVETLTFPSTYLVHGRSFNTGVPERVWRLVFRALIKDPCDMTLYSSSSSGTNPCT